MSSSYGINEPTQAAYPPGANSARTAAIATSDAAAAKQSSLIGKSGGKKKRRGGGPAPEQGTITVPVNKPLYPETGGPGNTIGSATTNLTDVTAKSTENAKYDNLVAQNGGTCPNWGCMSGGIKKMRKSRKSRKSRRSRRTRKSRRSRKSRK